MISCIAWIWFIRIKCVFQVWSSNEVSLLLVTMSTILLDQLIWSKFINMLVWIIIYYSINIQLCDIISFSDEIRNWQQVFHYFLYSFLYFPPSLISPNYLEQVYFLYSVFLLTLPHFLHTPIWACFHQYIILTTLTRVVWNVCGLGYSGQVSGT